VGICKSATTQPGASGSRCAKKSEAEGNTLTANPLAFNIREAAVRKEASSSTMWTVGGGKGLGTVIKSSVISWGK
jgi:hypothetical protein